MQDQIEAAHLGAERQDAEFDPIARVKRHAGRDLGRRRKNMTKTIIAANDHGANADQLDHFAEISTRGHCTFPLLNFGAGQAGVDLAGASSLKPLGPQRRAISDKSCPPPQRKSMGLRAGCRG
jgi:hypothetical protein